MVHRDLVKMSFISFKRQLSADLERLSSCNHGNKSTASPKSASAFRKLGSTSQNRIKPVRRTEAGIRNRNPKQGWVPVPPPPSRLEFFPPFLDGRTQSDWISDDDEILRHQNCSFTVDRNRVFLPGTKTVPGFSYLRNSALLDRTSGGTLDTSNWRRRFRTRFEIPDRRKEPTVRLVVNLPKTDMVRPVVTFSYKHGKI